MSWAWRAFGDKHAHGPFDTRDLALGDAASYLMGDGQETEIHLGRVEDIDPGEYAVAVVDADWLVERMEEMIMDEVDEVDYGPVFEVDDGAKQALETVIRDWAREHVTTNMPWCIVDEEVIVL